jgi:hypothetical protein
MLSNILFSGFKPSFTPNADHNRAQFLTNPKSKPSFLKSQDSYYFAPKKTQIRFGTTDQDNERNLKVYIQFTIDQLVKRCGADYYSKADLDNMAADLRRIEENNGYAHTKRHFSIVNQASTSTPSASLASKEEFPSSEPHQLVSLSPHPNKAWRNSTLASPPARRALNISKEVRAQWIPTIQTSRDNGLTTSEIVRKLTQMHENNEFPKPLPPGRKIANRDVEQVILIDQRNAFTIRS